VPVFVPDVLLEFDLLLEHTFAVGRGRTEKVATADFELPGRWLTLL
jgi:hypothetical protein